MTENGNGNGDERDDKGRFLPGMPGGPGRGNTRKMQEISEAIVEIKELLLNDDVDLTNCKALDPVGRVLLHGITSKDPKIRTDSAKLYFAWLTKMCEATERGKAKDDLPLPAELNNFTRALAIKIELDVMEAEGITDFLCYECKRKLGIGDEGLKENDRC